MNRLVKEILDYRVKWSSSFLIKPSFTEIKKDLRDNGWVNLFKISMSKDIKGEHEDIEPVYLNGQIA